MTHDDLVNAVYSKQMSSVFCFRENCINDCEQCSENLVKEYEDKLKADTIDEFYDMLKNPITLDALVNAKDAYTLLRIIGRQVQQAKGYTIE